MFLYKYTTQCFGWFRIDGISRFLHLVYLVYKVSRGDEIINSLNVAIGSEYVWLNYHSVICEDTCKYKQKEYSLTRLKLS